MMAMLLAAGRGERMRPLTDRIPKPLLEVGGKPLIVWHIENLVHAGITDLVVNHAHLGAQIEAALGDGRRFGAHIQYSPEASALETAGGIANALPFLLPSPASGGGAGGEGEPFAVINSDIYCDYDFAHLAERAAALQASGDMAHLVLVDNPPHHPNGDFALSGGRIYPLPTSHSLLSGLMTFSGIGIYRPSLFSPIPHGGIAPLAPLLRAQIALGRVSGEHHRGLWVDVGTPQRLAELDSQVCSLRKTPRSSHNAP
ncbi:MAG: nucleotidyltransferase family protein [Nitrosomonadales bacterium]|nr:nucleotidyltransferase family protein [Nitrosomonadales bacterium]